MTAHRYIKAVAVDSVLGSNAVRLLNPFTATPMWRIHAWCGWEQIFKKKVRSCSVASLWKYPVKSEEACVLAVHLKMTDKSQESWLTASAKVCFNCCWYNYTCSSVWSNKLTSRVQDNKLTMAQLRSSGKLQRRFWGKVPVGTASNYASIGFLLDVIANSKSKNVQWSWKIAEAKCVGRNWV